MSRPAITIRQRGAPLLPKFFRPRLKGERLTEAKLSQWELLTRFTDGSATGEDARDWAETVLTYTRMVTLYENDGTHFAPEAKAAIDRASAHAGDVLQRFARTGSAAFTGPQLIAAREAVAVMDALLDMDRNGIVLQASVEAAALMAIPVSQPRPQGQ